MNARQKAKKYKKELDILKNAPVPTQVVVYGVGDIVTYKAEVQVSNNEIFKFGYSDDSIITMLLDQFRDAIKDTMDIKVEDCLNSKRILAWLRLIKPRRDDEHITL